MTGQKISIKKKWEEAHQNLDETLEKEIHLMREILANLHQEELALLESDFIRFARVMSERSDYVIQIKDQRQKRMDSTERLVKVAIEQMRPSILPPEEELSCDILTKLDQLIALSERINLQNCRNDALFDQVKQKEVLPLKCSYPHPLQAKRRKKPSIATDSIDP